MVVLAPTGNIFWRILGVRYCTLHLLMGYKTILGFLNQGKAYKEFTVT